MTENITVEKVDTEIAEGEKTPKNEEARGESDLKKFLTFIVEGEEYGVDLLRIREIKGWTETTRLPNSIECMKGVINLRGAVIPIFDLKGRFSMGETEPTDLHVVIIMAVSERMLGILVDSVSDIMEVNEEEIRPAPKIESKIDEEFVSGLISTKDKMVVVLDIDKLFHSDSLKDNITKSAESAKTDEQK